MQTTRTDIGLHNGLPFEVCIPPKQIPNRTTMTDDEIDAALQVGPDECANALRLGEQAEECVSREPSVGSVEYCATSLKVSDAQASQ